MLKELFESIAAHARKTCDAEREGERLKLLDAIKDPREIWFESKGSVQKIEKPLSLRRHRVDTIADLASFVAWWQAGDPPEVVDHIPQENPILFVGDASVVCLLDGVERRDRVTLDLPYSDLWKFLTSCVPGRSFTQPELIRELRNVLADAEGGGDLLAGVRSLKVDDTGMRQSEITHGAEQMGSSIARRSLGADKIPETITANVVPYSLPEIAAQAAGFDVRVLIELDLKTLKITLTAKGDDFQVARDAGRTLVVDALKRELDQRKARATVFRGEVGGGKGVDE